MPNQKTSQEKNLISVQKTLPAVREIAFIQKRLKEIGNAIASLSLPSPVSHPTQTSELCEQAQKVVSCLVKVFRRGNRVYLLGNGGSAACAQHFAGELVNRLKRKRPALPALALTTDSSVITSIANDISFSRVFARQLEALGKRGDAVVAFSTSGCSPNILEALKIAPSLGLIRIAFLGPGGGKARALSDLYITVPYGPTPFIQEVHLILIHIIAEMIEQTLFTSKTLPKAQSG